MIKRLYVFANMGHLDQLPKSGGQSSARRVMDGLRKAGFEIVPIRRHRSVLQGKFKHLLETGTFAIIDSMKVFGRLLFGGRKDTAFIHLTYSASLVPYELWLTLIARALGYKSLLYLKGGKIEGYLKSGGRLSLWMFFKNLSLQSCVFLEGKSDVDLLSNRTKAKMVYFPNYIFQKDIPFHLKDKPKTNIGICYFGKIVPYKNVDVTIKTFNLLADEFNNLHLTIVGGGMAGSDYMDKVKKLIADSPYNNRIEQVGLSSYDYLKEMMQEHHFFLFPTASKCEGHSNALNEAMSQGLIPIVSNYHFNRSIVQDNRLVVDGYNPVDYAEKIRYIINHCNMDELSKQVWQLVKDNYVYENIIGRISKEIRSI